MGWRVTPKRVVLDVALRAAATGATVAALRQLCRNGEEEDEEDDDDLPPCDDWLVLLQASYLQINTLFPSPLQGLEEKVAHDDAVTLFCSFCPEECPKAPRFGRGRIH
jgi:hypothetical protein